ncbi:MAG: guanyl-specific ribonuclease Sa [Chloroflexi bacterium]|nr:guanyl-specific ribonuclease Sa [Chloroflexota bacterium]
MSVRQGERRLPFRDPERMMEVDRTLDHIETGGPFLHRKDGARYENYDGRLPQREPGYYREYTVETSGIRGRGRRRIVQGAGGETYYSDDHYESFIRIDPRSY